MIASGQYSARSAFAGESRTAGQAYGQTHGTTAKKAAADADSFSKLLDEGVQAPKTRRGYGDDRTAGVSAKNAAGSSAGGKFSFKDFILGLLDIINPLQHIPVVSSIYRKITGDEIGPMARVAGGALYGGPIGAAAGIANAVAEQKTGKDIGENVMAMVTKDKSRPAAKTETAAAATPGAAAAPKQGEIIWDDDMQQAAMKLTVRPSRDEMLKQKMNAPAANEAQPQAAKAKSQRLASPAAQALLQAQQMPKDDIAQKMMEGLDKYRAMRGTGAAF